MIGLGSFAYRWSCGFKGRIPQKPLGLLDLLERTKRAGLRLIQFADNVPLHERDPGVAGRRRFSQISKSNSR